jgi:glucose/arabinose dehydrogenase
MQRYSEVVMVLGSMGAVACDSGEDAGGEPAPVADCLDNGGISLPPGFCATIFADDVGRARHMAVTPSGEVFVNTVDGPVVALRDIDDDGVADQRHQFGDGGGSGIAWWEGRLFVDRIDSIVRYDLPDGVIVPIGDPVTVISNLPAEGDHVFKTMVIAHDGTMVVSIGSASNACQVVNRMPHSRGLDPCPELAERAGIWRYDATRDDQPHVLCGERVATGVRNAVALALDPATGELIAAIAGRDQLHDNWPELYSPEQDLRLPSEEVVVVVEGADYGWPYCYHDPERGKVLAPEYGGDGTIAGRCAMAREPELALEAHSSPLGMAIYRGRQFPARYRGGVFLARAGDPAGHDVLFLGTEGGELTGAVEVFADGFAGTERPLPDAAAHRPVAVAVGPDGSLYISDDQGGRIYRVFYVSRQAITALPDRGVHVCPCSQSSGPTQRRRHTASSALDPTQIVVASHSSGAQSWPSVEAGMHTPWPPKLAQVPPGGQAGLARSQVGRQRWSAVVGPSMQA